MLCSQIAAGPQATTIPASPLWLYRPCIKSGEQPGGLSGDKERSRNRAITALIEVEEANCVLVDDVVTTGATMLACRDALETAGGRCFVGVSLAIVQNERSLK